MLASGRFYTFGYLSGALGWQWVQHGGVGGRVGVQRLLALRRLWTVDHCTLLSGLLPLPVGVGGFGAGSMGG